MPTFTTLFRGRGGGGLKRSESKHRSAENPAKTGARLEIARQGKHDFVPDPSLASKDCSWGRWRFRACPLALSMAELEAMKFVAPPKPAAGDQKPHPPGQLPATDMQTPTFSPPA